MLDIKQDIHSLTDFKRNTTEHLERLRETGRPRVLTINGNAEVVVQDAEAYQKLLDRLDEAEAQAKIGQALSRMHAGEPGIPLNEALTNIREKLGLKDE